MEMTSTRIETKRRELSELEQQIGAGFSLYVDEVCGLLKSVIEGKGLKFTCLEESGGDTYLKNLNLVVSVVQDFKEYLTRKQIIEATKEIVQAQHIHDVHTDPDLYEEEGHTQEQIEAYNKAREVLLKAGYTEEDFADRDTPLFIQPHNIIAVATKEEQTVTENYYYFKPFFSLVPMLDYASYFS